MTITIPLWLLYALYVIGGVLIIGVIFVILAFAFVGWSVRKMFKPPTW